MFRLRPPLIVRVGEALRHVAVGAVPDIWVVVSTTASREEPEKKSSLHEGDIVRFTVQYGLRPKDDDKNMAVLRGKIVSARSPALPDSYGVQTMEVVKSHNLDPSVALPIAGQLFLVAPWSIAEVETPSEAKESPKETLFPKPEELSGKAEQKSIYAPEPESNRKSILIGSLLAVVIGLGLWGFVRALSVS